MNVSLPSVATAARVERVALVVVTRGNELGTLAPGLAREFARDALVRVLVLTDAGGTLPTLAAGIEVHRAGLAVGTVGAYAHLVALVRALASAGDLVVVAPSPLSADPDARAAARAAIVAVSLSAHGGAGDEPGAGAAEIRFVGADLPAGARVDEHGLASVRVARADLAAFERAIEPEVRRRAAAAAGRDLPRATAVVSTWNKSGDVCANLEALHAQTLPFEEIVLVDNHSRDDTVARVRRDFPAVNLIVMPHDRFGACETFNVGFKASRSELTAILDDDIVMPPDWLEKAVTRLVREPDTTAILSTQVVEPGTPAAYLASAAVNEERYMSTFRGCASLARSRALAEAGYYDERLFIYGNERDLTCRILNLGYRVLQYPGCGVFHRTPFGIKMGQRSLYYHARNAWISMLKYAPLGDLVRMPWLVVSKVVLRGSETEARGGVRDAVGTIGIGRSLRETKGAWWVVTKAAFSVLWNVPYCLRHRRPVKAPDFELPLH